MLKRNPEAVSEAVAALFLSVKVDVSRYLKDMLPAALLMARAGDEARRQEGLAVVKAMAVKSTSLDSLGEAVEAVVAVLKGSEGKLTQVGEERVMSR
eukprot:9490538-Pyramimonas_sp.AAC.1